ncbi:MAG: tetratricopeptide repeat protein [Proteobacteria bacterium]|nr:tetratricopeptide repeat protein [Pseudomonadota bacterium]
MIKQDQQLTEKLAQAETFYKQEKFAETIQLYEEIIAQDPENIVVLYRLSTLQLSQNNLQEALKHIDKVIEVDSQNTDYLQIKGSILARLGQTKQALKLVKKAIKNNPNLYHAQMLAGHLYFDKGDKKAALKHYYMVEKISQHSPEAGVNIAKIHIYDGQSNKAMNELKALEAKFPEDLGIKMMLGQALLEQGAYSFAESYFNLVLSKNPNNDLAKLYLGIAKLNAKDFNHARTIITEFNQRYPNTKEGLAALGLLMHRTNNHKMAVEYFSKAITNMLVPIYWQATYVESLAKLGKYDQAIAFYTRLENKYKEKRAIFRLAELYELDGNTKKAKKQYKKTEQTEGQNLATSIGLTRIYQAEDNPHKAEKKIKTALQTHPHQAEAILLLIVSLLTQNKQQQALEVLEKIDYQRQDDFLKRGFRVQHGLILDDMGKYQEAMQVFADEKKQAQPTQLPKIEKLADTELKQLQSITKQPKDKLSDPTFIIGTDSTIFNSFLSWMHAQGVVVLNDRLVAPGRDDIFLTELSTTDILAMTPEDVALEREKYYLAAKALINSTEEGLIFADCLFINPPQLLRIKKFFPNAKVILLTRATADIWLHQKVFGQEPIASKDWNETINQIISMGLNLLQIDIDKWLNNDKQTLQELSTVFAQKLTKNKEKVPKYWRKWLFTQGHWKNYKEFLGQ